MTRYVCIHGHFYQPPRENPWLEAVEVQDSAYPYHDWNKRISVECYAPNAASRILDRERRIIDIVNNYSNISFNFGPTLLSWMEVNDPGTYRSILESDRESMKRFSGHGSAIAQCYNHIIMPLASHEDREIQVLWGIKDFVHRFGRSPEGMWLPETAADLDTLDIMAKEGILFTILSPHQAKRARKTGSRHWHDMKPGRLNTHIPYRCILPSGRTISIFFYNSSISHDIAFGDLLNDGVSLAGRLIGGFTGSGDGQLVHIATDGETFGHHHRFGEMALSYALYHIEKNSLAKITVYGEYLELHPPEHDVEIWENSSWSCPHGIERWRSDCGCSTGAGEGWTQGWRAPLRGVMDWLRGNLQTLYTEKILHFTNDPQHARTAYIGLILDRNTESALKFCSMVSGRDLTHEESVLLLKLMEMERNAMLMYTSCGWFFDEISGIESVQIMLYAARAMQLASEISGLQLEETFIKLLQNAPSNYFAFENGADIYKNLVTPVIIDPARFGAHYSVSSLFREYMDEDDVYSYRVKKLMYERLETGKLKLALGLIHVSSKITLEETDLSFAVIHMGDHNIFGGVRIFMGEERFGEMRSDIAGRFTESDTPGAFRMIEKHFTSVNYSLWHLFRDEQRAVITRVMESAVSDLEKNIRHLNDYYLPVVQVIRKMGVPLPDVFSSITEFILNDDLKRMLNAEVPDIDGIRRVIRQMKELHLVPDTDSISYTFSQRLNSCMEKLSDEPGNIAFLETAVKLLDTLSLFSPRFERWRFQNIYFILGKDFYPAVKLKAGTGDEKSSAWISLFTRLGVHLGVSVKA